MKPVLTCLLLLVLAPAAPASAATVTAEPSCDRHGPCRYGIVVRAAPGEANAIVVSGPAEDTSRLVIRDTGAPIHATGHCTALDASAIECTRVAGISISAGDGDDSVDTAGVIAFSPYVRGGPGDDRLVAKPASGVLDGGRGLDSFTGGAKVDYASETAPVQVDLARQTAETSAGTERLAGVANVGGGRGDDRLRGDAGPNRLGGGPGRDVVSGGAGDDHLFGDAGRDVLRGGAGDDALGATDGYPPSRSGASEVLDCGAGRDSAHAAAPFVVDATCERLSPADFDDIGLRAGRRPFLAIPRSVAGPPVRFRATLRLAGARRVERRLRFSVPRSAPEIPPGSRKLSLTSRRIDAARRRGPVRLTVELRATVPDLQGPGDDARSRSRVRIRLPAIG